MPEKERRLTARELFYELYRKKNQMENVYWDSCDDHDDDYDDDDADCCFD